MTCKPRPISGNLPFDAISKDYNRYCDRIVGNAGGLFFNPGDLNPFAWYDFSDASLLFTDAGITPVSSDGDAIYQANDKSGNGNHLLQPTLAKRFLYKTGIQNGKSVGRSDGIDDLMAVTFPAPLATANTIFIALKNTFKVGTEVVFDGVDVVEREVLFTSDTNAELFAGGSLVTTTPLAGVSVFTSVWDGASSELRKNGVNIGSGDTGAPGIEGFTIGAAWDESSFSIDDFYEIIIVPSVVSATDITNVETYLNNEWGIF